MVFRRVPACVVTLLTCVLLNGADLHAQAQFAAGAPATAAPVPAIDLGSLFPGSSLAHAVDDNGVVLGGSYAFDGHFENPFLWTAAGGMIRLGSLGGGIGHAASINQRGMVVGNSQLEDGTHHAFSWTAAQGMVDLGTLDRGNSDAWAVNASGMVAGGSEVGSPGPLWPPSSIPLPRHAFAWTAATGMIDLGTLGGSKSWVVAINDSGMVIGDSKLHGDRISHAFIWTSERGMVDLGTLGGSNSTARAINDSGMVVGESQLANDAWSHAFAWTAARGMIDLGTLGGSHSAAAAINERGMVAGQADLPGDTTSHAMSWTPAGGMVDLETPGGFSGYGVAVNASGMVVGFIERPGDRRPAAWTPAGALIELGALSGDPHGAAFAVNNTGMIVGLAGVFIVDFHATLWVVPAGASRSPVCTSATAILSAPVFPLDHGMRSVTVGNVTDPDGDPVALRITGVCQDEPPNAENNPAWAVDGAPTNSSSAAVRSERSGTRLQPGNGRTYHVFFTADDGQGGTCANEVRVGVPISANAAAIDDGARYDSATGGACAVPVFH